MTERIETGGPAFPVPGDQPYVQLNGMSLRDWFAGQALAGLLSKETLKPNQESLFAFVAYEMADAMLKARGRND